MRYYKPKNLEAWTRPDNYAGDEFYDYYNTLGQSRDSQCLERANFQALLEKLGGESSTVVVGRFGHWAVGWVEAIFIHKSDTKALKIADKLMGEYKDYPVIDDDVLYEVENDELYSTIDNYSDEFRALVCSLVGTDYVDLSKAEKMEVDSFISEAMHEDMGYRGVEDAFITEESIQRAINNSVYWSTESNLVQYLKNAFNVGDLL